MLDIHTHILPGMDDGSRSSSESIEMLKTLAAQGVDKVVLSSHFYAEEESPQSFLKRREESYDRLMHAIEKQREEGLLDGIKLPRLIKGAEVCYYVGVSTSDCVKQLCIEGTPLFMLEMPRTRWDDGMITEILRLAVGSEVLPVLAHIDRYFDFNRISTFSDLQHAGVLMQMNAGYITDTRCRHKLKKIISGGMFNFLGTDCHGMDRRRPEMAPALEMLRKHREERAFNSLDFYEEEFFD